MGTAKLTALEFPRYSGHHCNWQPKEVSHDGKQRGGRYPPEYRERIAELVRRPAAVPEARITGFSDGFCEDLGDQFFSRTGPAPRIVGVREDASQP